MKLKNKSKIDAWLEQGEMAPLLDELIAQLRASKSGSNFLKTATSLSSQLEKLRDDRLKGVITYEQETVTFNKLHDKVQVFIEAIEKDKPKPLVKEQDTKPISQPGKATIESQKGISWWWAALPLLVFGGWWMFIRQGPIEAKIKLCTRDKVGNLNYCEQDMQRILLSETLRGIMVTAVFEGMKDGDPLIEGELKKLNGDDFPTQKIQLTLPLSGVGYSSIIAPASGYLWDADTYVLQLYYKGEVIGEKQFEIFSLQNFTPENNELVPLDSFNSRQQRKTLDRVSKLLKEQGN